MWAASEREDFERAARYRDLIAVVRRLDERQDVELPGRGDADVFAVASDGENATVCVLPYRDGKLVDKREFHFEGVGDVAAAELLVSFAAQYYEVNPAVPRVVETAHDAGRGGPASCCAPSSAIGGGGSCGSASPQRGPRARRVELALDNARAAFELRFRRRLSQAQHLERRLGEALGAGRPGAAVRVLRHFALRAARTPRPRAWSGRTAGWIGASTAASTSATWTGSTTSPSIAEAVGRRYRRLRDEGRELPDLVLIDGGVGQLNAAMAALDALGLELPLAAIAKREELIWLPGLERAAARSTAPIRRTWCSGRRATRPTGSRSAAIAAVAGARRSPASCWACRASGPAERASCSPASARCAGCRRRRWTSSNARSARGSGRHLWQHLHAGEDAEG